MYFSPHLLITVLFLLFARTSEYSVKFPVLARHWRWNQASLIFNMCWDFSFGPTLSGTLNRSSRRGSNVGPEPFHRAPAFRDAGAVARAVLCVRNFGIGTRVLYVIDNPSLRPGQSEKQQVIVSYSMHICFRSAYGLSYLSFLSLDEKPLTLDTIIRPTQLYFGCEKEATSLCKAKRRVLSIRGWFQSHASHESRQQTKHQMRFRTRPRQKHSLKNKGWNRRRHDWHQEAY